jgi:hypothetical protein
VFDKRARLAWPPGAARDPVAGTVHINLRLFLAPCVSPLFVRRDQDDPLDVPDGL